VLVIEFLIATAVGCDELEKEVQISHTAGIKIHKGIKIYKG
jgi:hypothetical protein